MTQKMPVMITRAMVAAILRSTENTAVVILTLSTPQHGRIKSLGLEDLRIAHKYALPLVSHENALGSMLAEY